MINAVQTRSGQASSRVLGILRKLEFFMRRRWLRLVALLNLVAFLFANTAGAMAVHPLTGLSACPCGGRASTRMKEEPVPSGCKHCQQKQETRKSEENQTICSTCGCSVLDGSCKCQTAKESHPPCPAPPPECPCPGSCPVCMAKVPCAFPASSLPLEAPCLEQSVPESIPLYAQPSCGRLIRPPRS